MNQPSKARLLVTDISFCRPPEKTNTELNRPEGILPDNESCWLNCSDICNNSQRWEISFKRVKTYQIRKRRKIGSFPIKKKSAESWNTWWNESTSEWNLILSPLSHLIDLGTLGTVTPPRKTRSRGRVSSSSIRREPEGPGLQYENRMSFERS